jgi:steroid delta-isomerase-like uncharacterized protein
MSTEQNLTVVRRYFDEVCNGRCLEVADELFTADHVYHDPSIPGIGSGPEGIKANPGPVATYQHAFSDAHWQVEDMFAHGDRVATRWVGTGTHDADLPGIPPTGNQVEVHGLYIQRLTNGKIAETWQVWDTLGMLQQLGVIPAPEQTPVGA